MSNIEAELHEMNALLKKNGSQGTTLQAMSEEQQGDKSNKDPSGEGSLCLAPTDRHVVRSLSDLTDRYHGPCTLFAFCNSFRANLLCVLEVQHTVEDQEMNVPNNPATVETVRGTLDQICLEAGTESCVNLQVDPITIRLPPKQLLLMARTQFFQQADYATDIFVQSYFWSNVDKVYGRPFTAADEAWAICFNTMILLVLGPESSTQESDSLVGSQFVQPFLLTVKTALGNPRVLMVAQLINVQALALLVRAPIMVLKIPFEVVADTPRQSVVAQIYYPISFSESIFAQACVLARTMGLHQTRSAPECLSSEEAQEREKVFISLYLRDKSLSILRGSICWLPSFDCSLPLELNESGVVGAESAIRIQLASLQDESYRLFHSGNSTRTSAKYKSALLHIEHGLEQWASSYELFSSPNINTQDIGLQLDFLATRICVFRHSHETSHVRRAISDSRASCLLVVISCGQHDASMIEQIEAILLSKSSPKTLGKRSSRKSSKNDKFVSSESTKRSIGESVPLWSHSHLDSFPIPAFFLLATNVILPSSAYDGSKVQDLDLLRRTCACYTKVIARTQADNHTRKLGRIFKSLLEVVESMTAAQQSKVPHDGAQQSNDDEIALSTSMSFADQHLLSEASNLQSPSNSSIFPMSWDNLSGQDTSVTTTSTSPRAGGSPSLMAPLTSPYQSYDPLRDNLYLTQMQQIMRSPSSKGRHACDLDLPMEYNTDARLLSGFSETNPSVSF